jgi:hypothetical protein
MASPTGAMPQSCWPWPIVDRPQESVADDVLCASGLAHAGIGATPCLSSLGKKILIAMAADKRAAASSNLLAPRGFATRTPTPMLLGPPTRFSIGRAGGPGDVVAAAYRRPPPSLLLKPPPIPVAAPTVPRPPSPAPAPLSAEPSRAEEARTAPASLTRPPRSLTFAAVRS